VEKTNCFSRNPKWEIEWRRSIPGPLSWAAALLLLCVAPAMGLDPDLACRQYIHTKWTTAGGFAVRDAGSLAQTADGYLWVGAHTGLLRFNGTAFTSIPDFSKVSALAASAHGGLWIAAAGVVARLDGNRLTRYQAQNGLPDGTVLSMLEDRSGALWLGMVRSKAGGLAVIRNGAIRVYGPADGTPHPSVEALFEDRQDGLWIGTPAGACQWSGQAAGRCWFTHPAADVMALDGGANNGLLLLNGTTHQVSRLDADGRTTVVASGIPPARLMRLDRDGNLWIGTAGHGLLRIKDGKTERFTERDGLSSDVVESLYEDRDGALWAGTANGLDRFREPQLARLSTWEDLSSNLCSAVCPSRRGGIWVGTAGGGIDYVQGATAAHPLRSAGVPVSTVTSLYEDAQGTVWAGTTQGLGRVAGGRFQEVLPSDRRSFSRVFAIAGNRPGKIWAADAGRGLFEISSGRAVAVTLPGVPQGRHIYSLYADAQNRLWVGFYEGGLAMWAGGGESALYTPASGLGKGPVEAIVQDRAGNMWVGTGEGLSRLRGGRWTTWTSAHGLPGGSVQAIVETKQPAQLWLESGAGMTRLDWGELDRTPDGAPRRLQVSSHGLADGIHFSESRKLPLPRVAQFADGRLGIATEDGLALLDPRRIPLQAQAPRVAIERVLANGIPVDTAAGEPAIREHDIEIEFAAIDLEQAEGVQFRYLLEGFDRQWSEPTTTRRIVYGHLPTGRYRFRVAVVDPDRAASGSSASIVFRCRPYYYETWPFIAFCAALVAMLVYGLHWLRMRVLRSQFALILKERTRVARELHDTLLQGFAGVVFLLNAASRQFEKAPENSRKNLEQAIEQSEQSLREARQALSSMRLSLLEDHTLPEALSIAGKQIVAGAAIRLHFDIKGKPRPLAYDVDANLFIIGREAINNAMAHANPQNIYVSLRYEREAVRLLVRDDGCGFDPQAPVERDHWGLLGMRERVKQIGGELLLKSEPGRGTTVEAVAGARFRKRAPDEPARLTR
jgi:signal transduction histidine kinase/ligand-binding sensor domain-containing protein